MGSLRSVTAEVLPAFGWNAVVLSYAVSQSGASEQRELLSAFCKCTAVALTTEHPSMKCMLATASTSSMFRA